MPIINIDTTEVVLKISTFAKMITMLLCQCIPLWVLWNYAMPTLGLPTLTYWKFVAVYVVTRSVVSGMLKGSL